MVCVPNSRKGAFPGLQFLVRNPGFGTPFESRKILSATALSDGAWQTVMLIMS
jgi:hypothetical protein